MSLNGEASAKRGRGRRSSKSRSRSQKAGLNFPVGRIERLLREGTPATRFSAGAPVYLAAVLEYLALEVLELAGDMAKQANKTRILPTHIQVAAQTDNELQELFGNATIPSAGLLSNTRAEFYPKSGEGPLISIPMSSNREASAKGGRGRRSSKSRSCSQKARLNFPFGRIERLMREGNPATRFSSSAPVYLAAVSEYLALEMLELAGDTAKQTSKTRITPTQIQVAVQTDNELKELFRNATIPSAGLSSNIRAELFHKSNEGNQ
ncbi:LOW QUALITY PROTEIN: uncharacterized protein LOC127259076 [Andrographis paniculata]|uniref:LOW QUALITY PROTEIN: uncharacterized protein LOC127259076 n=1 Tax=Andrographis paniculata TaxID=175694 RepID=UPI0021E8E1C8|nr:LOW QUALITY PROTEIN: uncharacterized protein LOC127259076 [Andrographis paniculata]